MLVHHVVVPLADTAAVVGDVFVGITALAALVAIIYAKRGAEAGRDAVREAHEQRVEDDYRQFGREVYTVIQAALTLRNAPDVQANIDLLHNAQTAMDTTLMSALSLNLELDQRDPEVLSALQTATRDSDPQRVSEAALDLMKLVHAAWLDRRARQQR